MKSLRLDYIDYWERFYLSRRGLKNRFGVRVEDGRCWALVRIGDDEASTFGKPYDIPVDPTTLPDYMRIIVEEDRASNRASDLLDVLSGRKSFQQALRSSEKTEVKRMASAGALRLPNAS